MWTGIRFALKRVRDTVPRLYPMKYLSHLFGVLGLLALSLPNAVAQRPSYVVADATTGYVLASSDPQEKRQVASLTKVATAMVVLDWLQVSGRDVNEYAAVPPTAAAVGGQNAVGFQPGDRVTLRDLLYAALLQSDNIAAQTLAEHVGAALPGEMPPLVRFVAQMNALARSLGMENTLFLTSHGLETEKKLPHSTAADMTRLARHAMDDSAFRFHVSQKERRISVIRPDGSKTEYLLRNTNELLGQHAIDGVKTGQTRRAGACVIISAARDPEAVETPEGVRVTPRRLIVTVLGSEDRFRLADSLLQDGWARYDQWAAQGRPAASAPR